MQNPNRNFWLGLFLLICFSPLALSQGLEAKTESPEVPSVSGELSRILPIRTHVVRPILLSFFKSDSEDQIVGEVFFPEPKSADKLILEAFDSGGSRIYIQEFAIDLEVDRSQKFRLQVPTYGLPAGSYMEARLYNQESQVGRDSKTLPQVEASTRYRLSNIESRYEEEAVNISLDFENGSLNPVVVRPQIKVWQQSITPEKIVLREFFEAENIEGKSRMKLNYDFEPPVQPGLYRVEVVALDETKKVLSGQQESFFVVPGDFAAFSGSFVTPVPGQAPGIELKFVGAYEGEAEQLMMELGVNLFDKRGKLVDRLTQNLDTPVTRGSFGQKLVLNGDTDELGKVVATVALKNDQGEWLAELEHVEDFMKGKILAPEVGVVAEEAEDYLLPGWKWWHWAGLLLALFALLGLSALHRRWHHKPKVLGLLLLLGFSFYGSAKASLEVFWHHPVAAWYYNANATGVFEDFGTMKVQGNIFNTLTQKGFFYIAPDRIVVSFFKDLTYDVDGVRICTDCFYLEADLTGAVADATCVNEDLYVGPEAEICDNKTYRFELELPSSIEEGQWGIQVLFKLDGVWYGTNWADEGSGDWYRTYFDITPPALTGDLTYGGTPPPLSGQLVYEAKQPIETGPTGLTTLHQTVAQDRASLELTKNKRDVLRAIADEKLKERNHKIIVDIFEREQAMANDPNLDLNSEITTIVNQINGLTKTPGFNPDIVPEVNWPSLGINDIAAILGQFVPPNLAVNPGSVLTGNYGIEPLLIAPVAGDQASSPFHTQITDFGAQIVSNSSAINLLKTQLRSIKQIHEKTAVDVGMICADPEVEAGVPGAACNAASLVAPVRGNFCEYNTVCANNSVRKYQVCDRVGNCADSEDIAARIDWYDPVAPDATDIDVIKFKDDVGGTETTVTGDGADNVFAAGDRISIEIDGSDPQADITTHPTLFDQDACGSGPTSDFFRANIADDFCTQSQTRCPLSSSKRGFQDLAAGGACVGDCPPGYALQGNLCVPFCDFRLFDGCFPFLLIGDQCEVTAWLPDPATVPFGDAFTQVNNCGQSRQSVGTKSITGTLNHFLDGKEVFGAYIYDTTEDTLPITYALNVDIDGGGSGGFVPYVSIQDFADMTIESVNSPSAGEAFKVSTFDVAGANRYGAWRRESIAVNANTDYILSYWVKTDATVNKDQEGAWVAITGNGSTTDIWTQYESTMEGVTGDLNWYKVIIPFTTPSGTTQIDVDLRVQQQNTKQAYFDDIRIFEKNWRFDGVGSWFNETLDDAGGSCDYIQTVGGVTVDGPDDRCGQQRFPEKAVLVYTSDGFYIFDAEKGTFWMKAVKDSNPSVFGRFVFNALISGQTFGLNGNLYLAHRFNEPNSSYDDRNGAVEVMNLINDEMYTHRMSGCYLLAGAKGVGSSYSSNWNCEDNGYYSWSGFVNDTIDERNITRSPWSNVMPNGRQLATHQINHASANVIGGKTYVPVATDYGISVLNKTDNTVQHLEWDGYNGDNYTWDYLHPNGSSYHKALLENDGSLWYKWDYNRSSDDGSRIWKLNSVSSLTFNNGVTTGNDIADSRIQPTGFSGAYPTTGQDEDSVAFDVQGDKFMSGGTIGLERFAGTLVGGDSSAHPNLLKTTANKNYATAPLYGNVLGHWVNSVNDTGDYDNDLSNQGSVATSAVASGADLTQFDLNGSSQYLSSGSSDFSVTGPITFGAWVKTTGSEDGGYIMAKGTDSVLDFAVYRKSDNTLRVTGTADTDIPGYTLGQTTSDWDYVVVSFDGTSKKTFLNGQLISNVADTKTTFDGSGASGTVRGRYVRIEQTGQYLSLAEVQVFDVGGSTNLALAGTATQVDDYGGYAVASRAIDNDTNGAWSNGSVTHTASAGSTWWEVDLGAEYDLGTISVFNRTDCCSSRLSGAVVSVLDASRSLVSASSPLSSASQQDLTLTTSSLPATRYVRVEKTTSGTYPYLYLAEVQAFNLTSSNIATSGSASSYSPYTSASRAIDGSTNGEWYNSSVFRTNYSTGTTVWWEVDLGSEQLLSDVTVWNRTDSRWTYLAGAVVKLLDGSRATMATSDPLSSNTTQNPVFNVSGGGSGSLFIGSSPIDSLISTSLLNGAVALPFMSEGAYTVTEVQALHDMTVKWLNANTLITLQGTSNDVFDVVFGDDDDYFAVTSFGITHFDSDGIVIRTLTTGANSSLNTQIISDAINDIDYKNRYLILAYDDPDGNGAQQARGLEIITIGTQPND